MSSKILKVKEFDLTYLKISPDTYYICRDTNNMYKDTEDRRIQLSVITIATEVNRVNYLKPINGRLYYVWETNVLWVFSSNIWKVLVGNNNSNNYLYSNSSKELIDIDNSVIDNNGLLKDGSVVIRDSNRIVKGKLSIDSDNNNLVISSFMGGGITLYPNGYNYSLGSLKINPNTITYIVDKDTGKRIIDSDISKYIDKKIEEMIAEEIENQGGDSLTDDQKASIRSKIEDDANNGLLKQEIMQSKTRVASEQKIDGYAIYNGDLTVTGEYYVQDFVEDNNSSTGYTEVDYKVYHQGNLDPSVYAAQVDLEVLQERIAALEERINILESANNGE